MESLYVNTPSIIRSETNGIAERAVRKRKLELLLCRYNPAWMKNGGLIPWNATVICEMSQNSWQMGEQLLNCDLENHSKAASFRLVQWLNILLSLRKTIQGSINLVRTCYWKFLGHALFSGEICKGDILVADIEEVQNLDASDIHARRLNAKKIITPKSGEHFIFSIAYGTVKLSGRDHGIRKSTLTRDQPVRSEDLRGDLQGSSTQPTDDMKDDREGRKDFWSIERNFIYRHHVQPRVQLNVPKEEAFQIPLKYIDVTRTTHINLGVLQESRIHDYWNVRIHEVYVC